MPVRLESLRVSDTQLHQVQNDILPVMWFMTHHLECTISTCKPAWRTLTAWICAQFSLTLSLRQRIWTLMPSDLPQQHWIACNTAHRNRAPTSRLACQEDQVTTAPGEGHTWTGNARRSIMGSASQARKRNFAVMEKCFVVRNRVGFYDLSLYFAICDIPSQGICKVLCKNSRSLCKIDSSGLCWPATPHFSHSFTTPFSRSEMETERKIKGEEEEDKTKGDRPNLVQITELNNNFETQTHRVGPSWIEWILACPLGKHTALGCASWE